MRNRRRREKTIWHYFTVALSAVALIFVVAVVALTVVIPKAVGGSALTVLTQSMEPGLPPGTLVIIRPTPVDQITVGQIVTYQVEPDKPAVITHRVISRTSDTKGRTTFITKGDNNSLPDANPVQASQVRGRLWYSIPWLGYPATWIADARGWLIPAAAVGLFGYALFSVITWGVQRRRRRLSPAR